MTEYKPADLLPYVKNVETIRLLRNNNTVRYAEPMAYEPQPEISLESDSGCGGNPAESGLQAGVDYTTISPNTKQSWNYSYHNIPTAWTRSTGAGVKIFIPMTANRHRDWIYTRWAELEWAAILKHPY